MRETARGQSETIGIVLLTAVFVVVAVTAGAFVLSDFDSSGATGPTVDIGSDIRGQDIVIEHRGGESLNADEIAVVVRGDFEQRWQFSEFDPVTGEDSGTFAPGNRWMMEDVDGILGKVDLLVVEESEHELLHDAAYTIEAGGLVFEGIDVPATTAGTTTTTSATVRNTGDTDLTRGIELRITEAGSRDVLSSTSESVTIPARSSKLIEFEFEPETSADLQLEFNTPNETVTETVRVEKKGKFFVEEFDAPDTAIQDDSVAVTADIENRGSVETEGEVTFHVTDEETGEELASDRENVQVAPDEPESVEFTYDVPAERLSDIEVAIGTEQETHNERVEIQQKGELKVKNLDAKEVVQAGTDDVTVTATIENTGDISLTQSLTLITTDQETGAVIHRDSKEVRVAGTDSMSKSFEFSVPGDQQSDLNVSIETKDDIEERSIRVLEVGELVIEEFDVPESAEQNQEITIDAKLNNTGETELEQTVEFTVVDDQTGDLLFTEKESVTAGPGLTGEIDFDYTTGPDQENDIEVAIASADDSASDVVEIEEDDGGWIFPEFKIVSPPDGSTVEKGDKLTVEVRSEFSSGYAWVFVGNLELQKQRMEGKMNFEFETAKLPPGELTIAAYTGIRSVPLPILGSDQIVIDIAPKNK